MNVILIDHPYYIRDNKYMYAEYHRKAMRCPKHNYLSNAIYFITVCCQNRRPLFGCIKNHNMILNPAGQMIHKWWQKIPDKFTGVLIDEFIVMPDHVHGIINITNDHVGMYEPTGLDDHVGTDERTGMDDHVGTDERTGMDDHVGTDERTGMDDHVGTDERTGMDDHVGSSLQEIVGWFKTMTTNEYIRNVKNNGWRYFDGKLWQRSYYDRIVRNDHEYLAIKKYIKINPNHHN